MRDLEERKFDFEWCVADEVDSPEELKEILEFEVDERIFEALSTEEQSLLRTIGNKECTHTPLLFVSPSCLYPFLSVFPLSVSSFRVIFDVTVFIAFGSKLFSRGVCVPL